MTFDDLKGFRGIKSKFTAMANRTSIRKVSCSAMAR